MCGIGGFFILGDHTEFYCTRLNRNLLQTYWNAILDDTRTRGRHCYGLRYSESKKIINGSYEIDGSPKCGLANFRGQPTTEVVNVNNEFTVQPFSWEDLGSAVPNYMDAMVVHNGIISNDVELLKAYPELISVITENTGSKPIDSWAILSAMRQVKSVEDKIRGLVGGYAFGYYERGTLVLTRNFKDLWWVTVDINGYQVVFFASKGRFLPGRPVQVKPYSVVTFSEVGIEISENRRPNDSALVVLSGGLDSTTVATLACQEYSEVHLLHFHYGCKAQTYEDKAVEDIYKYLHSKYCRRTRIHLHKVDLDWLKAIGGSRLTDDSQQITEGDESAEFCSEWVPARNLVMASVAAAYCDRYGINIIMLGNNLEESAVYGDNSLDFFSKLEEAMDVGTQSRPLIKSPLGNLMKSEIMKLAYDIRSPIHLSRSCYHDKPVECCSDPILTREKFCGPCTYKAVSLKLNGLTLDAFRSKCEGN